MPELAEVEFYRRRWDAGLRATVLQVALHAEKRIFRGVDVPALEQALIGAKFVGSEANGKQMLFRFSNGGWLGLHLGMSGHLRTESADYRPGKHDHLVLYQKEHALIFEDARLFGRVRFDGGKDAPEWWTKLPPSLLSDSFTADRLQDQLSPRSRSPLKAALLDQALFPGVGNWLADEILWQARLHPSTPCGRLLGESVHTLWKTTRSVCKTALATVGEDLGGAPVGWLFHVRWKAGGKCPRDGKILSRETIAGRTTAWCSQCQP